MIILHQQFSKKIENWTGKLKGLPCPAESARFLEAGSNGDLGVPLVLFVGGELLLGPLRFGKLNILKLLLSGRASGG